MGRGVVAGVMANARGTKCAAVGVACVAVGVGIEEVAAESGSGSAPKYSDPILGKRWPKSGMRCMARLCISAISWLWFREWNTRAKGTPTA